MFNSIGLPVIVLGGMAVFFGIVLAYASKKFAVEVNPKVTEIRDVLPGANCGGCGFAGCDALAEAIASGNAPISQCPVGGSELAAKLAVNAHDTLSEKTDWVLHSIACRAAIKAGDQNPAQTLLSLAKDILDGVVPPFCPHGRPVLIHLSQKELEKQFGRRE